MENLEGAGNSRRLEGESTSSTGESIGSLGADETSPDLLKNTPSNIRRLAHEIHQCEARQKYLAQTRSPSDGVDIRWYFCKTHLAENELAASVPRTEIVGKGDYFRFGMRDSLAIEAAFLQREEELLSSWWKEYAECSEGPKGHIRSKSRSKEIAFEREQSSELYTIEEERVGVPVKGGLYEVDLVRRQCFPVYWNGDNRRVLRGHWFARKGGLDWLPLREDVSEQLEFAYHSKIWHRRTFQPSGLFAARVDLQGSASGLHALFTGEDDTWEAWVNADAAGFTGVMSFGGNGIMLRRGYAPSQSPKPTQDELRQQNEEDMDDYCSQVPVRHVVFMVHGIGQRLEKSNLVDDVGHFRHITASLAETHLTSYQRGKQRVLYIPCQWRKGLKLGGESAVEKITLDGVRGLRMTLSATVHDVLYYMSPIYCQDIIDSVSNQLNRLYSKFLRRNPGYDGKVSLYGHSLGSVLSYDILCHQEHLSSPFPMEWMYKQHGVNEHAAPATIPQSSENESSSNQEHNKCIENNECKSVTTPMDADKPTLKDMEKQLPSIGSDESSVTYLENNQPQAESLLDMQSTGMDDFSEDRSIENEVSYGDSKNMSAWVVDDEKKDGLSKQLELEVDSLKERIAQLESQLACKVKEAEPSASTDLSLTERIVHGQVDEQKSYTPYIRYTKLEFKVDTFFAVGSPLGVFLALRNVRIGIGKGKDYWHEENITEEMPCCRQMVNIFHPFDPVAYRLEPLTCEEYINKRPVIIPYHKGGKRLHIGFQEFTEDLAARSQTIKNHLISVRVKVLTLCQSRDKDNMDEQSDNSHDEQRSYGVAMMQRLSGSEDGRVDHVLQDKTFRHQYLSAISSHTNYWRDSDTALFMLKHLYRDIPEEQPDFIEDSKENSSKSDVPSGGWVDQRESIEEELPLTFGDTAIVKKFSSRAKKFMKFH